MRDAFLLWKAQNFWSAHQSLRQAKKLHESIPDVRYLQEQLPSRTSQLIDRYTPAVIQLLSIIGGLGLFGGVLYAGISDHISVDWAAVLGAVTLLMVTFFVGLVFPRITGISFGSSWSIELASNQPVEELVHADLDLSASRLLLISGFSNHRPTIPFDDVESRLLDPRI